jgi:hypothetical protein
MLKERKNWVALQEMKEREREEEKSGEEFTYFEFSEI